MGTGRTVVLYCAPRAESLGSHPQTGLGGWTLWRQNQKQSINDRERQNSMVQLKKTKLYSIITVDL